MALDPSLLVSLEALLRLRNVTAAAREHGITQSAMSQRLRRLRDELGDPLLVPGAGGLVPTARAEAMQPSLEAALRALESAERAGQDFDPATCTEHFVIGSADLGELLVLPLLMARLQREAPGVTVRFSNPGRDLADLMGRLERGEVDLAVGGPVMERAGFRTRVVGQQGWTVVCRRGHPVLGDPPTLEQYLSCRHLLIAPRGQPGSVVDGVLAAQGLKREVVARVGNFVPGPFVVAASDLVMTAPTSLALALAEQLPLALLEPPLALPLFDLAMLWHERRHHDPAHRWLRRVAVEVTREGFAGLSVRG